jgi:hypothetical protein
LIVESGFLRNAEFRKRRTGTYNSGYVVFRHDENGLRCVTWWRDRCIEWCHKVADTSRWTDQKYLDEFPLRFAGVRSLSGRGVNVGLWNVDVDHVRLEAGVVIVSGWPLICYHFTKLVPVQKCAIQIPLRNRPYMKSSLFRDQIYLPYLYEL